MKSEPGAKRPKEERVAAADVESSKVCTLLANVTEEFSQVQGVGICPRERGASWLYARESQNMNSEVARLKVELNVLRARVEELQREVVQVRWEKAILAILMMQLHNYEATLERIVTFGTMFFPAEAVYLVEVLEELGGNRSLKLIFHSDHSVFSPNEPEIPWSSFVGTAVKGKTSATIAGAHDAGTFKVVSDPSQLRNAIAVSMIGFNGQVVGAIVWQNRLPAGSFNDPFDRARLNDFVGVAGNAFESAKLVRQIKQLADYDQMTGLIRRDRLVSFVEEKLTASHRFRPWIHFAIIDLDGFKAINDNLGHTSGDRLIKVCAAFIKNTACGDNIVCSHWGGDEFAFALVSHSQQEGQQFAEELRSGLAAKALSWAQEQGLGQCCMTASVGGVSIKHANGQLYNELVKEADAQLGFAKNEGKNRVKWRVLQEERRV